MRWKRAGWVLATASALAVAAGFMITRPATAQPQLEGTILPGKPAPDFRLSDQFGRSVALSRLRGHPVVLTFMETHCQQLCPVVAEKLRFAVAELGLSAHKVDILAITTDPEEDTPASARQFSRQHGLLHRWHFLLGKRSRLAPIWNAYYVYAAPPSAPAKLRDSHTSVTYLIDASGRERVLMGGDPDNAVLVRDLRLLSGLPLASTGTDGIPAPEVGHPAPVFSLPAMNGSSVRLSAFRGRIVLLNFWATWCAACKSEMPRLASWSREMRGHGLVVLGIDQQESPGAARPYIQRFHIPYVVLQDQSGDVSARYDVVGLPTSLLIDDLGTVVSVRAGTLDRNYLANVVKRLL